MGTITEQYKEQLHSLYGDDIFPDITKAGDIQVIRAMLPMVIKMTKLSMCMMVMKMLAMVPLMRKMMTKMLQAVKKKTKLRNCKVMMKMLPMVQLMRVTCNLKACRAIR